MSPAYQPSALVHLSPQCGSGTSRVCVTTDMPAGPMYLFYRKGKPKGKPKLPSSSCSTQHSKHTVCQARSAQPRRSLRDATLACPPRPCLLGLGTTGRQQGYPGQTGAVTGAT